jgi:hypothetical protein
LHFVRRLCVHKNGNLREKCRKSPAYLRNIPVFGRLCAETFFDLHCAIDVAVFSGLKPDVSYGMWHLTQCSSGNDSRGPLLDPKLKFRKRPAMSLKDHFAAYLDCREVVHSCANSYASALGLRFHAAKTQNRRGTLARITARLREDRREGRLPTLWNLQYPFF